MGLLHWVDGWAPASLPDDELRRARLLVRLCALFVALAPLFGLLTVLYFQEPVIGLATVACSGVLLLPVVALRRTRSPAVAVSALNLVVLLMLLLSAITLEGARQVSNAWLVMLPLLAVLIGGLRAGAAWGGVSAATAVGLLVATRLGALPEPTTILPLGAESSTLSTALLSLVAAATAGLAEVFRVRAMRALQDADHALAVAREVQAQQDRLATVGTLATGVAHELNNPLAVIGASAGYLLDEARAHGWGEEAESAARDIAEAGARAAAIVRDLRDFTQPVTDLHASANLATCWSSAVRLLRPELKARAHLEANLPRSLPEVAVPPTRQVQVLLNLLTNALQATEGQPAPEVRLEGWVEAGRVHLTLTDNGRGMTEEQQRRAFDPFFTTRPPGGGVGLGLFVAHSVVSAAGGRIACQSTPGKGTTMHLTLPVARGTLTPPAGSPARPAPRASS